LLADEQDVFCGTQYHPVTSVEKDSYVIENDLYVRIRRLRLIMYHRFLCVVWVIFIGGMSSIWVLSEMQNGMGSIRVTGNGGRKIFPNNI
jgi:hypothetical protein